jgi:hypothetical protein
VPPTVHADVYSGIQESPTWRDDKLSKNHKVGFDLVGSRWLEVAAAACHRQRQSVLRPSGLIRRRAHVLRAAVLSYVDTVTLHVHWSAFAAGLIGPQRISYQDNWIRLHRLLYVWCVHTARCTCSVLVSRSSRRLLSSSCASGLAWSLVYKTTRSCVSIYIYIMHPGAFCITNAQTLRLQLRSWTNCNLTDQLQLDANQLQLDGPIATQREPIATRLSRAATRRERIATKRLTDCNCDTTLIATRRK